MKYIMTYEENKFFDFIKDEEYVLSKVKEYLKKYEPNITNLEISVINRVRYNYWSKNIIIWFRDHRVHFEHKIELNKKQSERLIQFINNPEVFDNINKYNL